MNNIRTDGHFLELSVDPWAFASMNKDFLINFYQTLIYWSALKPR